jgi:hypothetical protein
VSDHPQHATVTLTPPEELHAGGRLATADTTEQTTHPSSHPLSATTGSSASSPTSSQITEIVVDRAGTRLDDLDAIIVGHQNTRRTDSPPHSERDAYRRHQRDTIRETVHEFERAPILFDFDVDHTDPHALVSLGATVELDPETGTVASPDRSHHHRRPQPPPSVVDEPIPVRGVLAHDLHRPGPGAAAEHRRHPMCALDLDTVLVENAHNLARRQGFVDAGAHHHVADALELAAVHGSHT